MAYHYTGIARRKILTVTKGSYSQSYNICSSFTINEKTYPALSDDEFARLSQGEYEARLDDFCDYVYDEEDGLQADCPDLTSGSTISDPVSCPVNRPVGN